MVYCVGLTGGIGSGKSTVARLFAERGAAVIDTDAISHALTQPNAAGYRDIVRQFGAEFVAPDGRLDRARLRQRIFTDPDAKTRLEAILHPMIREQVAAELAACRQPYAIVVVPLLFETGAYADLVDRTLTVDCSEAAQIQRTMQRSGLSEADVRAIMAHQLGRAERRARADDTIHNDGDLEHLRRQVDALHARYLAAARR